MTVVFAKTKFGKWGLKGAAAELAPGKVVQVPRLDGSVILKKIRSVSKPFDVDGMPHVYGYVGGDICATCKDAEIQPDADSNLCQACSLEDLGLLG